MLTVLSLEDRKAWDSQFEKLAPPQRDVHFSSAYAAVQQLAAMSEPLLLVSQDQHVMQPVALRGCKFGMRKINDLNSLYGYGGAVGMTGSDRAQHDRSVEEWCRLAAIVSEHRAEHPCFRGADPADQHKEIVTIDLTRGEIERDSSRRIRRAVAQARSEDAVVLQWQGTAAHTAFWNLYQHAMQDKRASERWAFSPDYFEAYEAEPTLQARWFFCVNLEGPQRGLLTITSNLQTPAIAYAHFLGSTGMFRHSGLDALLYVEAARRLSAAGVSFFHLGGGMSDDPNDTLLRFKKGFQPSIVMTAARKQIVYFPELYRDMVKAKAQIEIEEHGRESTSKWFPAYRRPFE